MTPITLQLFYTKIGAKTHLCSRNDIILKIGHFAKTIAKQSGQEWFILGWNLKEPKAYKNDSAITLQHF